MNLTGILERINQAAPLTHNEAVWIIGIFLAFLTGVFLGYWWQERKHAKEIAAILRITRRKEEAMRMAQKEKAPQIGAPPCPPANYLPC